MTLTPITVSGAYKKPDGTNSTGKVRAVLSHQMRDSSTNVIVNPRTIEGTLVNGAVSLTLIANNNPTTLPLNTSYRIEEYLDAPTPVRTYDIVVPYDAPLGALNLADVVVGMPGAVAYARDANVYAEAYGVVADGTTDDTLALQAAATAATAATATLVLPAGVIMVNIVQNINLALILNGRVQGAGKGKTTIRAIPAGMARNKLNRMAQAKADSYVHGVTFDGNNTGIAALNPTWEANALDVAMTIVNVMDYEDNVTFDECEFINQYSSGTFAAEDALAVPPIPAGNTGAEGFGITIKSVRNFVARNCDAYNNSGSGFGCNATTTVLGINVPTYSARFEGCQSYDNGYKSDGITARAGFIGGKGFASSVADDITVVNCRSYNNVEHGVNFEETLRGVVDNCDIFDNGEAGVRTFGYGEFVQVMNSRVRSNGNLAAGLTGNSKRYGNFHVQYADSEVPAGLVQKFYIYNTVVVDFVDARARTLVVRSAAVVDAGALEPIFYTNNPDAGSWNFASQLNTAAFVDDTLNGDLMTVPYTNDEAFRVVKGTVSIAPGVVPANSRVAVVATITGIATNDILVLHQPSAIGNSLIYGGHAITAADTITVYFANPETVSRTNNTALLWKYEWHDYT